MVSFARLLKTQPRPARRAGRVRNRRSAGPRARRARTAPCRGANALAVVRDPRRDRRNVTARRARRPRPSAAHPVKYHHSVRNSGWLPWSRGMQGASVRRRGREAPRSATAAGDHAARGPRGEERASLHQSPSPRGSRRLSITRRPAIHAVSVPSSSSAVASVASACHGTSRSSSSGMTAGSPRRSGSARSRSRATTPAITPTAAARPFDATRAHLAVAWRRRGAACRLAAAREHLCAERRGQPVIRSARRPPRAHSHGERAIEDAQRCVAQLAGRGHLAAVDPPRPRSRRACALRIRAGTQHTRRR